MSTNELQKPRRASRGDRARSPSSPADEISECMPEQAQSRSERGYGEPRTMPPPERKYAANAISTGGDDSFTARLRYLFASRRQRDGSAWTLSAVARATQGRLSLQQISKLYYGKSANPQLETVEILADVFGIEPEYFVRKDALASLQERDAAAYSAIEADPQVAFVSRRMGSMSAADKALLVDLARRLGVSGDAESVAVATGQGAAAVSLSAGDWQNDEAVLSTARPQRNTIKHDPQDVRAIDGVATEMSRDLSVAVADDIPRSQDKQHGQRSTRTRRSRTA